MGSQQANNMLQTAEGGLDQISNILGRMRELAVQSASDGGNADDRASIDLEYQQLKAEITRIGDATEYNGTKLINGHKAKGIDETTLFLLPLPLVQVLPMPTMSMWLRQLRMVKRKK